MRQHNYWKMQQLQTKYMQIALWLLGLVLLAYGLFNWTIEFNCVSTVIGIICVIISAVMMIFENFLWKVNFVQKIMMTVPIFDKYWTPVLEGRWKGTLQRDNQDHDFVLEIKQTYTSISCVTYSHHSSSSAISSDLLYDEQNNTYQLAFYWHAYTTRTQPNTGDKNVFNGFTVMNVILEDGHVSKLKGSYFTDRQPKQTHGTIKLFFEQKSLKQSFE